MNEGDCLFSVDFHAGFCGSYFDTHSFRYCRYNGSMSGRPRDDAIATFQEDAGVTLMLVSLKCGGVGLHLTAANR